MPGGFSIDLVEVGRLADTLEHAEERMTRSTERLRDAGPKDLGSPFLDKAAEAFQEDWEDGIEEIADLTGDIAEGLRAAMKAYRKIDESIGDSFGKGDPGYVAGPGAADVGGPIVERLQGL